MLAFDSEVYGALLAQYGASIWPLQLVALLAALTLTGLVRRPPAWFGRAIAGFLALLWAWSGLHFHAGAFSTINFVAPAVAAVFVLQALALAGSGLAAGTLVPRFGRTFAGWVGLGLVLVGLIGYPILGLPPCDALTGVPPYKAAPALGTSGTAAALVTLGFLSMSAGHAPWHLAAIPLCWLVVAGIAAGHLGMVESPVLLAAAVLAFCAILWNNHARHWVRAEPRRRSVRTP